MNQLINVQDISTKPGGPAAALNVVLCTAIASMPSAAPQEVRVILGQLKPGEATPRHSHRFPVIVYVVEGVFSLELADGRSLVAAAGEAMVEPAHVAMVGRNTSDMITRLVMTYVSEPGVPFADLAA
jgi:quercetin dioxygenase-like cupin family protein